MKTLKAELKPYWLNHSRTHIVWPLVQTHCQSQSISVLRIVQADNEKYPTARSLKLKPNLVKEAMPKYSDIRKKLKIEVTKPEQLDLELLTHYFEGSAIEYSLGVPLSGRAIRYKSLHNRIKPTLRSGLSASIPHSSPSTI